MGHRWTVWILRFNITSLTYHFSIIKLFSVFYIISWNFKTIRLSTKYIGKTYNSINLPKSAIIHRPVKKRKEKRRKEKSNQSIINRMLAEYKCLGVGLPPPCHSYNPVVFFGLLIYFLYFNFLRFNCNFILMPFCTNSGLDNQGLRGFLPNDISRLRHLQSM